ncbi:MAG TPA: glutamate-1-semialdehyde 2,1-aminomutase, partial [Opitutales bacterium]|nr:glutamate-1-semialdehyde 2,1-aminomutase [Opitutales bacterium]
ALFGHNHPRLKLAVAAALEKGASFGTPHPGEVPMAETLAELVPSLEMVRLCNSGTEATMSCLRLARGFTGRDKIIKFAGCYHGHADALLVKAGSGALTHGYPDSAGVPAGTAADTIVLPFNDLAAVDAAFAKFSGQIAAIILEPYPANVGLILPDAGYLAALRERCTRAGALLIFDEVMTGFRLAAGGVQEISGVKPDLTALGKIIGGGLPVGAFGGRRDVMEKLAPLGPVYQAGTLSGNPLAVAAGLAALTLIKENPPYAALDVAGQKLAAALRAAAKQKGLPLQVPQTGSMFALFFTHQPVRDYAGALAADAAKFKKVFHAALDAGVYLPPSAYETCFLSTAHDAAALDRTIEVLAGAVTAL